MSSLTYIFILKLKAIQNIKHQSISASNRIIYILVSPLHSFSICPYCFLAFGCSNFWASSSHFYLFSLKVQKCWLARSSFRHLYKSNSHLFQSALQPIRHKLYFWSRLTLQIFLPFFAGHSSHLSAIFPSLNFIFWFQQYLHRLTQPPDSQMFYFCCACTLWHGPGIILRPIYLGNFHPFDRFFGKRKVDRSRSSCHLLPNLRRVKAASARPRLSISFLAPSDEFLLASTISCITVVSNSNLCSFPVPSFANGAKSRWFPQFVCLCLGFKL